MTASRMVAIWRSYLGVSEHPPGSNRTIFGERFGMNGYAWCAMFLWCGLIELGFKVAKNAGSHELITMLGHLPGWKFVPVKDARKGDLLDYTWRHVGGCEARPNSKGVVAIEGNHNDRVARVPRANSSIARVLRPPYASEPKPQPDAKGRFAKVRETVQCYNAPGRMHKAKDGRVDLKAKRGGEVRVHKYAGGEAQISGGFSRGAMVWVRGSALGRAYVR